MFRIKEKVKGLIPNWLNSSIGHIIHPKIYIYKNYDLIFRTFRHFPINKKVIVFESEGDFTDNTRALYDYMIKRNMPYKYVWMVDHPENFHNTSNTKFTSFKNERYKRNGLYYLATAKHIFFTHCMITPFNKRKGQIVVRMTHGFGFKGAKGHLLTLKEITNCAVLCPLEADVEAGKVFGIPRDSFVTLGYPRNDLLINTAGTGKDNAFAEGRNFNKLILWMPTFRQSVNKFLSEDLCDTQTGLPLLETEQDLFAFNDFLHINNIGVLLKVHHLQKDKPVFHKHFSNIIILNDEMLSKKNMQLYEMVGKTDALLTDYSSIAYDYMLIDKPIGFILDDLGEYKKSRGLLVDNVEDYMPDSHIFNVDDLKGFILDVAKGLDKHKEERDNFKNKFLGYTDNHSCERIIKYFGL
jgi:CDP-glycerol glycerophosphotransferase